MTLQDRNWSPSRQRKHDYVCFHCNAIRRHHPERYRVSLRSFNKHRHTPGLGALSVYLFKHPELTRIREERRKSFRPLDAREASAPDGFVYIVEDRDNPGVLKIGKSRDPARRLAGALTFVYRADLYLAHAVYCQDMAHVERLVHEYLRVWRDDREWFHVDVQTAAAAITHIARRENAKNIAH